MPSEPCRICDAHVSFSNTVHVMMNPRGEEGVVDYYVCRSCYDEHLAPLFARPTDVEEAEAAGDGSADDGNS